MRCITEFAAKVENASYIYRAVGPRVATSRWKVETAFVVVSDLCRPEEPKRWMMSPLSSFIIQLRRRMASACCNALLLDQLLCAPIPP